MLDSCQTMHVKSMAIVDSDARGRNYRPQQQLLCDFGFMNALVAASSPRHLRDHAVTKAMERATTFIAHFHFTLTIATRFAPHQRTKHNDTN